MQSLPTKSRRSGTLYRLLRAIAPLRDAVRFARKVHGRCRPQAWRLEGAERQSGAPLAMVFAGQLQNKNYLAHLAFADAPVERALGRHWFWTFVPPRQGKKSGEIDLRIVESNETLRRWLSARFQFFIPTWVGGELDIQRAVARLHRSRNAKKDLRRMLKNEVTSEVTRDPSAFEYFYWNMYLPYIRKRFGDCAFAMRREEMVRKLGCAELFFVKVRGERIAGHILLYENGGVRAWSIGIKDGDRAHIRTGALKALDYLTIQHVAERGYRTLHLGGSRPFLLDGVLRHKRERGVRISDHTARYFSLSPAPDSMGARAFFANNPFIYESDGTYLGAFFVEADSPLSRERLLEFHVEYHIEGLVRISLFDVRAGGKKILAQISPESLNGQ